MFHNYFPSTISLHFSVQGKDKKKRNFCLTFFFFNQFYIFWRGLFKISEFVIRAGGWNCSWKKISRWRLSGTRECVFCLSLLVTSTGVVLMSQTIRDLFQISLLILSELINLYLTLLNIRSEICTSSQTMNALSLNLHLLVEITIKSVLVSRFIRNFGAIL